MPRQILDIKYTQDHAGTKESAIFTLIEDGQEKELFVAYGSELYNQLKEEYDRQHSDETTEEPTGQ